MSTLWRLAAAINEHEQPIRPLGKGCVVELNVDGEVGQRASVELLAKVVGFELGADDPGDRLMDPVAISLTVPQDMVPRVAPRRAPPGLRVVRRMSAPHEELFRHRFLRRAGDDLG
jgi:hypothetical protein